MPPDLNTQKCRQHCETIGSGVGEKYVLTDMLVIIVQVVLQTANISSDLNPNL